MRSASQRINNTDARRIVLREINAAVLQGSPVWLRQADAETRVMVFAVRTRGGEVQLLRFVAGRRMWCSAWPGDEVEIRGRGVVWVF